MISSDYESILKSINGLENFGKRKNLPKYLETIIDNYNPTSILDFGCGVGSLIHTLELKYPQKNIYGYDPGNKNFSDKFENQKFDLVISTDVLEHIEPEFLDQTLEFLKEKSNKFYHLIALAPSRVILPDGRNAHLILKSKDWWKNKFVDLGYTITFEKHMHHRKGDRMVNKYFISGTIN
jgi:cyclopropane fatty-acyl-phospholipid synthase-like methyltransferase